MPAKVKSSPLEVVVQQEAEELLEDSLEGEVQEITSETEEKQQPIKYSFFDQEELMELGYDAPMLDYEKLWYNERTSLTDSEEEGGETKAASKDTESEYISNQEAERIVQDIHYAAVLGTMYDVDEDTRSDLNLWIMFNPELFKLFESTYALSRDVNYY